MTNLPHFEGPIGEIEPVEVAGLAHQPHLSLVDDVHDDHPLPTTEADLGPAQEYRRDWKKAVVARTDQDAFDALHEEFTPLIRLRASRYFLPGGEGQDLIQEATIGFYNGVRGYNGRESSLRHFLELCISRQVITAVKTAGRLKHGPLNQAVSLSSVPRTVDGTCVDVTFEEILPDKSLSPEDDIVGREELSDLVDMLSVKLSDFESAVLLGYMNDKSYETIAEEQASNFKAVDNALQRVRNKVNRHLAVRDKLEAQIPVFKDASKDYLAEEQKTLEWIYESWLRHVYDSSSNNLCTILSDLNDNPEGQRLLIREVRGHLARLALDSGWRSPMAAYNLARGAVVKRAKELSADQQSSESHVIDTLLDSALKAVSKT